MQAAAQAEAAEAAEAAASAAVEARAAAAAVAEARLVAAEAAVEAVEARAAAAVKAAVEAKVVAVEAEVAGGVFRFDTAAPAASVAAPPPSLFGGDASRAPPGGPGEGTAAEGTVAGSTADGEWTQELEAAVRRQVVSAMDNYPPQESGALLDALVAAAARGMADGERSLRKLASLTRRMEALEAAAGAAGGRPREFIEDDARALRSQIRMWAKDGEKYEEGSWLNILNKLSGRL